MVSAQGFALLKLELSVKAKNGLDFILAASLVWLAIAFVWTLPNTARQNGFITFFVGALLPPLARLFSALLRTMWTVKGNPLQPLGRWLNFAQLFYFQILLFIYSKYPQHFIMTYAIITGAHFFPYTWFYNAKAFAVMAGVISAGSLLLGLRISAQELYLVPAFTAGSLVSCELIAAGSSFRMKMPAVMK